MKLLEENERHYFVDEAGDLTLFNKKGKIIVGTEGCSKFFIVGVALLPNSHDVRKSLMQLKEKILADSYLSEVKSLKKTALCFHAKDDCQEVRMEVYKFIQNLDVKFYAIVRRKQSLVEDVKIKNKWWPDWRYNQNDVYDECIKMLFKDRLHIAKSNHITFASRGKTSRNEALRKAITQARHNFSSKYDQKVENEFFVISNNPSGETCLQIIDYGLWALQRLFEMGEERHFNFLRDKFERVIDLDDKRSGKPYGVYYDKKNQLSAEKIKNPLES